jgi:putative transposase
METKQIDEAWRIPDELWQHIQSLLPKYRKSRKGGRPRLNLRKVMDGIFYVARTGCQWKALPPEFGSASAVHDYFQEWTRRGIFRRLWRTGLQIYDELKGIDWEWQAIDGAMSKAPLGGQQTGKNPTDRSKIGTKRSLWTDGDGIPLGVTVSGANTHDKRLVEDTLNGSPIDRPKPTKKRPQHLCLDKGYDYEDVRETVTEFGYTAHIPHRGEDPSQRKKIPGYRARRWVVERTHSWMNRFRRLLIRWEKKAANYTGLLHFACAWIAFRAAGVFG